MEMGLGGGTGTVCSFIDGATSLYLSTGSCIIGVGTDERANAASRLFIGAMEGALKSLTATTVSDPPATGDIRFVLRIGDDLFGVTCKLADVHDTDHPLHPLWLRVREVLLCIRRVSQERGGPWSNRAWIPPS
jgi:hypothetical protein